ncbi:MAG: undecaprenyl-phosphate glucose phosphotransferase [Sulfuriferula sp.]
MNGSYEHPALSLAKRLANPLVILLSWVLVTEATAHSFTGSYLLLGVLAFLISAEVFDEFNLFDISNNNRPIVFNHIVGLLSAWLIVLAMLFALGLATDLYSDFDIRTLRAWALVTPVLLYISQAVVRRHLESLRRNGKIRRAVVVGANDLGHKLANHIHQDRNLMIRVDAFFDDRLDDRSDARLLPIITGGINDVADYVGKYGIDMVYITLPVMKQPRVLELVNALRDTAVSVYFVPDIFIFDLVQTSVDDINGVPIIAVFESPLIGINGVHKWIFDVLVSGVILTLISPLLIVIALLVKFTSKGPVFFKQRRYGLDGEEIMVYKFRSMVVCEDGPQVTQATQNDARVTTFGAILRKTSLDELPQFINVLQGSMSIVGPRPHAVAHNEHYRKLIHGYMCRHKVKPGITGLAQINGFRGETDTIEKMEGRVLYDINYLKDWSIWLDILIIFKTIKLVFKDSRAY